MPFNRLALAPFSYAILIAGLLFSCQPTHKEKVQKAVKNHLKNQASDSVSYNPKEFGPMDSIYLGLEATTRYQQLTDTFKLSAQVYAIRSKVKMALTQDKKDSLKEELARKRENLEKRKGLIEKYKAGYEPKLVGFWQPHAYKMGDSAYHKQFKVDTTYNVVETKPYQANN